MLLVAKFPMFQISVKIISYDLFHGHKILVEAIVFLKKIKIKPLWSQEHKRNDHGSSQNQDPGRYPGEVHHRAQALRKLLL